MEYLDLEILAKELEGLEDLEEELDDDDTERLAALKDLESQLFTESMEKYARNESTLIPEEEFEDYAQELAYDGGFATRADDNPLHSFIDWLAWADYLKADYTEVTFDDNIYLIRAY